MIAAAATSVTTSTSSVAPSAAARTEGMSGTAVDATATVTKRDTGWRAHRAAPAAKIPRSAPSRVVLTKPAIGMDCGEAVPEPETLRDRSRPSAAAAAATRLVTAAPTPAARPPASRDRRVRETVADAVTSGSVLGTMSVVIGSLLGRGSGTAPGPHVSTERDCQNRHSGRKDFRVKKDR
ncbi:MAG: hypothetical protein QOE57_1388 [Acidimicrobiaceae bacterium]|nr:hypothetical protein [Acidimicrobiaceae bacterium]